MKINSLLLTVFIVSNFTSLHGQIPMFSKTYGDTLLTAVFDTSVVHGAVYSVKINQTETILFGSQSTANAIDMSIKGDVIGIVDLYLNGYYCRNVCQIVNDSVVIKTKFSDSILGMSPIVARQLGQIYTHVSMPDPYHIYCKYDDENYLITFDLEGNKTVTKL